MRQRLTNGLDHAFEIVRHVIVHETNDAEALGSEPGVAALVAHVVDVVCCAIKLDDEFALDADEIDDEPADGVLAADFQSVERSVA